MPHMNTLITGKNLQKKIIVGAIFFATLVVFSIFLSDPANAQFGLGTTAKVSGLKGAGASSSLTTIIARIISSVLGLVGAIFFLLMLYAGFLWMTARGNEDTIKKAKGTLANAIIGIIIIAAAYGLTSLVITTTLGEQKTDSSATTCTTRACTEEEITGGCDPDTEQMCSCIKGGETRELKMEKTQICATS